MELPDWIITVKRPVYFMVGIQPDGRICFWCNTDTRTGKKVKKVKRGK